MGITSSRSTLPGHSVPGEAKTSMSPIRSSHPVEKPPSGPQTPERGSCTAYEPLTPPPSGNSKRLLSPEHGFSIPFNPTTPPASSDSSAKPPFSPGSEVQTPLATSPISPDINRTKQVNILCSNCYRPIIHHRHHPSLLAGLPLPRMSAPNPLKCGHRLCKRCIRTSLLASLSTDPFQPASCSGCSTTPRGSDNNNNNDNNDDDKQKEGVANEATTIPLAVLGSAATAAEFLAYREKLREMRTPVERRLYCHDREGCGMFLASEERVVAMEGMEKGERPRAGVVVCPLCEGKTCRGCGMRSHWYGGKFTMQEGAMGRKRRRERSLNTGRRKRRKCNVSGEKEKASIAESSVECVRRC